MPNPPSIPAHHSNGMEVMLPHGGASSGHSGVEAFYKWGPDTIDFGALPLGRVSTAAIWTAAWPRCMDGLRQIRVVTVEVDERAIRMVAGDV